MRPLLLALVTVAALVPASGAAPAPGAPGPAAGPLPAPPAQGVSGTVVARPRFVPAAGPILAGDGRLAWVTRRDDAVLDLWVSEPGQGSRRVQRFSGSDTEDLRAPRLSASATEIGLELSPTATSRGAGGPQRAVRTRSYRGAFGEPLRPLAPGAAALAPLTYTDPSGRAVWVTRGCASAEISIGPASAPATSLAAGPAQPPPATSLGATLPGSGPRCTLRLRRPATVHGDRLHLGVSCAGFRIACTAEVIVRGAGRVIARGPARYNHATPPYAAAELRLTAAGSRLLRGRSRTRVRITARIADASRSAAVTRSTSRTITRARR